MLIERTFRDIPASADIDDHSAEWLTAGAGLPAYGWDELLKSPRILILAEAGAGKTHECKARRSLLKEKGHFAFFVELAHLAADGLRASLDHTEEALLDEWMTQPEGEATFFLDSLDELKLTRGSFERALKRLGKDLAGLLARARFVITTRPTAFDLEVVRQHLPLPPKQVERDLANTPSLFAEHVVRRREVELASVDRKSEWRRVVLTGLDHRQRHQLAQSILGVDPSPFLEAVEHAGLTDFAHRPIDLLELCAAWQADEALDWRRSRIELTIDMRLRARDREEPAPITDAKAREGAERLALAMQLTQRLSIRVADNRPPDASAAAAIDPALFLPDWTLQERDALLQRPLFGFSTYGCVRFHHRSVIPYLAARRLAALVDRGMSVRVLKRLLFGQTAQGKNVVKPALREVAAWLSARFEPIFRAIIERDPAVLLASGDPGALPIPWRRQALSAFVNRYGTRGWRGLAVPSLNVYRFSAKALETDVRALWDGGVDNVEVRSTLLGLMESGAMLSCRDIICHVAGDATATIGERRDALRALAAIDPCELRRMLLELRKPGHGWPLDLVSWAVVQSFPDLLSPTEWVEVIAHITEPEHSISYLRSYLPDQIADSHLDSVELDCLRAGLDALVRQELRWSDSAWSLRSLRQELLPALGAVCLRLWPSVGQPHADLVRTVVLMLRCSERRANVEAMAERVRAVLSKANVDTRQLAFWHDVDLYDAVVGKAAAERGILGALWHGAIEPGELDVEWLRVTLGNADAGRKRRNIALQTLFRILAPPAIRELAPRVADDRVLKGVLEQRVAASNRPIEDSDAVRRLRRLQRKREVEEAKRIKEWTSFAERVEHDPDAAFSEQSWESSTYNLWNGLGAFCSDRDPDSFWMRAQHFFSEPVAVRLRQGLQRFWRNISPQLPSERGSDKRNTTYGTWHCGLLGLHAEATRPDWPTHLSANDRLLACRYVPIELNGFPVWLGSLARFDPAAIRTILGQELLWEMANAHTERSMLLQNVRHAEESVQQLFAPLLHKWLETEISSADNLGACQNLDLVLQILISAGGCEVGRCLLEIATQRIANDSAPEARMIWAPVLAQLDPARAADWLEHYLGTQRHAEGVEWIARLFHGDGREPCILPSGLPPEVLGRFCLLACLHVRHEDDLLHEGVYTPGTRDFAERARDSLVGSLLRMPGVQAWEVKMRLVQMPQLAPYRDRMLTIARQTAAEEIEAPSTPDTVTLLESHWDFSPRLASEMLGLIEDRIGELEDTLSGDTSPREGWSALQREYLLRREIARHLTYVSRGVYIIDQESVTGAEKEMDLRLRSAHSGIEGVIELKVADNWTASEMREALELQLRNRYLEPVNRRAGCLLAIRKTKRRWKLPNGPNVAFDGLIAWLDAEARSLINGPNGPVWMCARGLDLMPVIRQR